MAYIPVSGTGFRETASGPRLFAGVILYVVSIRKCALFQLEDAWVRHTAEVTITEDSEQRFVIGDNGELLAPQYEHPGVL